MQLSRRRQVLGNDVRPVERVHVRNILARCDDGVDVLAHERLVLNVREGRGSAREEEGNRLHLELARKKTQVQSGI